MTSPFLRYRTVLTGERRARGFPTRVCPSTKPPITGAKSAKRYTSEGPKGFSGRVQTDGQTDPPLPPHLHWRLRIEPSCRGNASPIQPQANTLPVSLKAPSAINHNICINPSSLTQPVGRDGEGPVKRFMRLANAILLYAFPAHTAPARQGMPLQYDGAAYPPPDLY